MAKNKGGRSKGYVSAGVHSNVSTGLKQAMRAGYKQSIDRALNEVRAYAAGKPVMVTIENPNKAETNKRFIRVPASQVYKNGPLYRYPGGPERDKRK